MKINKRVKITDKHSAFFNREGIIWNKGNGNMWQVGFCGMGIYFDENQIEEIKMERYHKKVYFPKGTNILLKKFTDILNYMKWQYTKHTCDNLDRRLWINLSSILTFISRLKLDSEDIFEFYIDDMGGIIKACYRVKYSENMDIILVVSYDKKIVTIYSNKDIDLLLHLPEYPESDKIFTKFEAELKKLGWNFNIDDCIEEYGTFHNYVKKEKIGLDIFIDEKGRI